MAIVDARENLFHEHGSVLFGELTSRYNLVEKLTTLADIGDNIVPLLVLEEFVHLQDVRVVEILQVVDLIEKHLLLVIVHVRLSENLHCSLGARLTMDANTDFAESAGSKHFSNSVVVPKLASVLHDEVGCLDLDICSSRLRFHLHNFD